jgi:hypothetical protein
MANSMKVILGFKPLRRKLVNCLAHAVRRMTLRLRSRHDTLRWRHRSKTQWDVKNALHLAQLSLDGGSERVLVRARCRANARGVRQRLARCLRV